MADPIDKDDPDEELVLNLLDSDEIDAAATSTAPPDLVGGLVRVRAIMHAFDSLGVAPASTPPTIPKWGPFVLREQVGRGRFGTVCRGFDPAVQRDVAVKLYAGTELPAEPRLMARVRHPNVVTVFGAAVHEGRPGIWMELIHGHTLGHRVESDGPLPPEEVLRIGIALCDALAAVHAAQLVHQDVKARNVMQEDSGRVVLMDFGAGLPSGEGAAPERLSGTPVYMAPEVVLGARPSVASDVYSLGVLLYYLLTGTYPVYASDIEDLRRLHERHHRAGTRRFVATLRELRPEVSPALARCLARALAPTERRYRTADEFETALEAVRLGLWERPRRRLRFWAAVTAAVAVGVAAEWWITRPAATPPLVLTRLTSDESLSTDPSLSSDGKLLVYASDRSGDGNLDLWVQQTAGGEPLRITRDAADDAQPSFSPDGSKIVFRSERNGGGLFVVSALGGDARRLAAAGSWPRFSPNGQYLAYRAQSGIVIASPEGRVIREIPVKLPPEVAPVWSPDGRWIMVAVEGLHGTSDDWADWDWVVLSVDGTRAPIETGAVDAIGRRRRSPIARRPNPWCWTGHRLLFDAALGDSVNLWEVAIDDRFHVQGPPKRLTTSSESQYMPSADPEGRIVFSTQSGGTDFWSVVLRADGSVEPDARNLHLAPLPQMLQSLSDDGRWLAFASSRLGHSQIWIKDFETGATRALSDTRLAETFPAAAHDGRRIFYHVAEGDKSSIYASGPDDNLPERICQGCGFPTDVSPDGRSLIVQQSYTTYGYLGLLDIASAAVTKLLQHPAYTLFRGHFSPDGRWIAFHAAHRNGGTQEFVARYQGPHEIPQQDWIPVTDGAHPVDVPRWSPDGRRLYFLSARDGYLCIWSQALDPETRRPAGEPVAVYHAHNRQRSLTNIPAGGADMTVGRDKIVFGMGELKGNIWSAERR